MATSAAGIKQFSKYFTTKELTKTETGLSNVPTSADYPKLQRLGQIMDVMYEKIGPFKIVSGYRSPAVQATIKAAGNVQAASTSYHSTGQAADIMPVGQTVQAFFAKLTSTPAVRNLLGGYAIKTNVIHFDTDTTKRQGVAMYVDKAGQYIRFQANELKNFVEKNKVGVAIGGGMLLLIGAGLVTFMMMNRGKK